MATALQITCELQQYVQVSGKATFSEDTIFLTHIRDLIDSAKLTAQDIKFFTGPRDRNVRERADSRLKGQVEWWSVSVIIEFWRCWNQGWVAEGGSGLARIIHAHDHAKKMSRYMEYARRMSLLLLEIEMQGFRKYSKTSVAVGKVAQKLKIDLQKLKALRRQALALGRLMKNWHAGIILAVDEAAMWSGELNSKVAKKLHDDHKHDTLLEQRLPRDAQVLKKLLEMGRRMITGSDAPLDLHGDYNIANAIRRDCPHTDTIDLELTQAGLGHVSSQEHETAAVGLQALANHQLLSQSVPAPVPAASTQDGSCLDAAGSGAGWPDQTEWPFDEHADNVDTNLTIDGAAGDSWGVFDFGTELQTYNRPFQSSGNVPAYSDFPFDN